jgi:two-component system OmpR family response regulator
MMRVLLVVDDDELGFFVGKGLKEAGFTVDHASDGESGLYLAIAALYDVGVIDGMLPDLDGLSLVEQRRRRKINTPVIILCDRRAIGDQLTVLQTGSDDYLAKPFAFAELLRRIQALLRTTGRCGEATPLVAGDLLLDLLTREVMRSGKRIDLEPLELSLLECLVRNPERVLSKTLIMKHVWHYDFDPQMDVVDAFVCRLKNKVDNNFDKKMIHTLRGVGYVLKVL